MISPIITDLTNIKVIRTFEFRKDQIDWFSRDIYVFTYTCKSGIISYQSNPDFISFLQARSTTFHSRQIYEINKKNSMHKKQNAKK